MSSLAVTMCREDSVTCALVHDRTDKALFGRLLAGEILMALFVEECGGPGKELSQNLKDFKGFGEKIAGVVQNTVQACCTTWGPQFVSSTAVMGEGCYQMPYLHHDGRCELDYISLPCLIEIHVPGVGPDVGV